MSQETTHIPKLRFPEFEGEWIISTIGEDCKFSSGGTPSKENSSFWNGDIPWISAVSMHKDKIDDSELKVTELGSKNGARIAPKGSILILVRGSMLYNRIPAGICQKDVTFNQDVKCLQVSNRSSSDFFLHSLRSSENRLLSIVTGTGIGAGKIDSAELKAFPFLIPSISEQQKIASFLTAVDQKIEFLQRKKDQLTAYKKGMMQKLFSQEIRFKDDDGKDFPEWEEKKLGELFDEVTNKVGNEDYPTYSITAGKGFVSQAEKFGRDISGKQNEKYTALAPHEFSYNKGNSKSYKYGCIYLNNLGSKIAVPNVFISFTASSNSVIEEFYAKLFEHHHLDRGLRKIISSGARMDGLLNVNKKYFFELKVPAPHPAEQQKIANYLTTLDRKIELVNRKLIQAQSFKKGLLQQMFI